MWYSLEYTFFSPREGAVTPSVRPCPADNWCAILIARLGGRCVQRARRRGGVRLLSRPTRRPATRRAPHRRPPHQAHPRRTYPLPAAAVGQWKAAEAESAAWEAVLTSPLLRCSCLWWPEMKMAELCSSSSSYSNACMFTVLTAEPGRDAPATTATMYITLAFIRNICLVLTAATENARRDTASKNQLGLREKIFIRSTVMYVFNIAELFITTKTKILYYSSSRLNEQAVQCLVQFYITVQTVQQFSHFSASPTRKWMSVR